MSSERLVIITGVTGGIGRGIAAVFAKDGWTVRGIALDAPDESMTLDRFVEADLRDPASIREALESVADQPVRALVNNAGVDGGGPVPHLSLELWDEVMEVNARGALVALKCILPNMADDGAVVNIASVHALATSPGVVGYAASKGALVALTRAAALDLAASGIRVNAVVPGAVDTPMLRRGMKRRAEVRGFTAADHALEDLRERTPLRRVGRPADIGEAVLFLADSRRSGFITGTTLVVDGGALAQLSTE